MVYLHGGCFIFGSILSHQALVSHLSKDLGLPFLFIEYSLAPEKPYPCAVNDVLKVYHSLSIRYPLTEFIVMGDSAGAWLSVALLSKITEMKLNLPQCNVMISPWIDLSCSYNSITENANIDPILRRERLLELAPLYIDIEDVSTANAINFIKVKFPPTLILVGSNEILLDDSKLVCEKLKQFQTKTKLCIYENQTHVWLLDDIGTPASQDAVKEIDRFIKI